MKNQKMPEDFTAKYEQIRLRSKQRLIGGIIILIFALFLLLYVVAKIKPLSSHTTIIMKTKASDTEQLAIKEIVSSGNKHDTSSNMIQVVDKEQQEQAVPQDGKAVSSAPELTYAPVIASAPKIASHNNIAKAHKKPIKIKKTKEKEKAKALDPEAILEGHATTD